MPDGHGVVADEADMWKVCRSMSDRKASVGRCPAAHGTIHRHLACAVNVHEQDADLRTSR